MIPVTYVLLIGIFVVGSVLIKVMPSFILLTKFTYPNAKYNAIGNPFIKQEETQKVLTRDLEDFKNTVNMTKDFKLTGESVADIQQELDEALRTMVLMVRKDSPKRVQNFYDAYLYKLDLPLIRRSVREIVSGGISIQNDTQNLANLAHLPETRDILNRFTGIEPSDIPQVLREFGYPENLVALLELSPSEIDFCQVEIAFDKVMFNRFENLRLPKSCKDALDKFIGIYRDIVNIKTILRAKEFNLPRGTTQGYLVGRGRELEEWKLEELLDMEDVPEIISHLEGTAYITFLRDAIVDYEKEKSVAPLERAVDICFLHLLTDLSVEYTLNLGVGIRFLVSKEYEIQNLKVITKGISENMSPDTIKKLLVIE